MRFRDPETGCTMFRDDTKDTRDSTIRAYLIDIGVPDGFERISWANVQVDQKVYLWGACSNRPHAYGPHYVYDKEKRQLHNNANVVFVHMPEELLVKW